MFQYNAPIEGIESSIDGNNQTQMRTFYWIRKSLTEQRKQQFFLPLSSTIGIPAHMGKRIRILEYIPLLDDRNINSMGIDPSGITIANGNLYGSKKDTGYIASKMPVLSETGGRVNRVGFTRVTLEGSLHKFGLFFEWTDEAMKFDSDEQLYEHITREMMTGAVQVTEDCLQADLLNSAGVIFYAGAAITDAQLTGNTGGSGPTTVSYTNIQRLSIVLDENRTPKQTKIMTGVRLTDTRTIPNGHIAYVGSELIPLLTVLLDPLGRPAFIPVQQYAAGTEPINGEIGMVGELRFVVVPHMQHWAAAGAVVTTNAGYRTDVDSATGQEKYNVYPILVVGDESFNALGFQIDGKGVKMDVIAKKPGQATANFTDPYGEMGFYSVKWYYGFLAKRPERIALIKTVAPL